MKSTQKRPNNNGGEKNQWQMPSNAQVFLTPGAQKSIEEAERRGVSPRIISDRPKETRPPSSAAKPYQQSPQSTARPQSYTSPKTVKVPPKKKKEPLTLTEAILSEIRDRLRSLRMGIQVNSEDIIRGVVCGALMMLFALLQTTFFSHFTPFGKIPDLMLIFVIAIGVYEGEHWGTITGLASAFIIQALGYSGNSPELLSLVYMPVGCAAGLLSKYYLRHTLAVNGVYVACGTFIRMLITIITACMMLDASFGDIILKIAIPEYFSTIVISPIPFFAVWISFRRFHKTRAERTDSVLN